MDNTRLSELRQELRQKLKELDEILEPAFERTPVFPGYFQMYGRRCGRPECRCAEGELHRSPRVLIRFHGGQVALAVKRDEADVWREKTDAYRSIREAGRELTRWHNEVKELLDAVERARRSTEDLPPRLRRRKLR
jgi:hypothetical protein